MPKRKITHGPVELPAEAFKAENIRIRISIMIPGDVLSALRAQAAEDGVPYQTYVNKLLRDAVGKDSVLKRLERIEAVVLKKAG